METITMNNRNGVCLSVYELYDKHQMNVARIILTGDGYLFVWSEWGNYAYYWPKCGDIRKFIMGIGEDYFANKMMQSVADIYDYGKAKMMTGLFVENILPLLQEAVRIELRNEELKGKRLNELEPVYVDFMPYQLEAGKLYISERFGTTSHLCPCGCQELVVMPINKEHGWNMTKNDGKITLRPSVGNFELPCKSHYYITENKIEWL